MKMKLLIIPAILLLFLNIGVAIAQTESSITATPNNSNIFRVVGSGFDASSSVTLVLKTGDAVTYTFPEIITTDEAGAFNAIVIVPGSNKELSVDSGVEYSLKKYLKTYKLFEEYDKKAIRNPEELADAGRLRETVRRLQKPAGKTRTTTSI